MDFAVKELDASTWDAFAELVERNNGIFGGCWCTAFHPEEKVNSATVELFEDSGFTRQRRVRKHAWIVSKTVEPAS